jgi:hypothetical protein
MGNGGRNAIPLDPPIGQIVRSKMLAAPDECGETGILNTCITQTPWPSY